MKPFSTYYAKAGIGITQHQHSIRPRLYHQLIARIDDVAHCSPQVIAHSIHINIRIFQFKVTKEDAIQVIIIVLTCMSQKAIKILPAFVDNCRQTNNFRAGTYYNQEFQASVLLKLDI